MLVARVGEFEAERTDVRAKQDRQHFAQGNVVGVRSFPIAPAAMEPDPFTRDVR